MAGSVKIPIGRGLYAELDAEDEAFLRGFRWRPAVGATTIYAVGRAPGDLHTVRMHRLILGLKPNDGLVGDHKDWNGLNNRRDNLRIATHQQNIAHGRRRRSASGFRGVIKSGYIRTPWRAALRARQKVAYLGSFKTKEEAAMRYNVAARKFFGEFAVLNQVDMG